MATPALLHTDPKSLSTDKHAQHVHPSVQVPPKLKRTRIQLSCTHCRTGKLKCDRQAPCNQCSKRDRSSTCTFPTTPPRRKQPAVSLQNRLEHLESLVKDVMSQTPSTHGSSSELTPDLSHSPEPRQTSNQSFQDHRRAPPPDGYPVASGSVVQSSRDTAYIGATHWAAILDDIEEVKSYFDEEEEESPTREELDKPDVSLLFRFEPPTNKADLIAALPHRPIVDKLVSRYFKAPFPSRYIIHKPSFQRQYRQFWEDPTRVSLPWLAQLHALLSHAVFATLGAGEPNPDERGSHMEMINLYRRCCSQALVLGNYTQPEPHTIEAMMLYMEAEFAIGKNDQINCYVLIGVAIRLALRIGLHRDASKIGGNITVCQAEMRRRTWFFLGQVDLLASFHIGLPSMIQSIESDAAWPRNLRDEDFDEDSSALPPARPQNEMTPMSYVLCKGGISVVFGQIAAHANRLTPPTYDEILRLDDALNQEFVRLPSFFHVVPLEQAITDSVEIIIQRFSIAILYHKSRCVLHRKYLANGLKDGDAKTAYSKQTALDASVQLLRLQSTIHDAVQPNGLLARETWFFSTMAIHDFLLAATVVYLTLVHVFNETLSSHFSQVLEQHRELIKLLERCGAVWKQTLAVSSEVKKAAEILELMIGKVNMAIGIKLVSNKDSLLANSSSQLSLVEQTSYLSFSNDYVNSSNGSQFIATPEFDWEFDPASGMTGDPFGGLLDPMNFDWDAFDNHLRPQPVAREPSWDDFSVPEFHAENF